MVMDNECYHNFYTLVAEEAMEGHIKVSSTEINFKEQNVNPDLNCYLFIVFTRIFRGANNFDTFLFQKTYIA